MDERKVLLEQRVAGDDFNLCVMTARQFSRYLFQLRWSQIVSGRVDEIASKRHRFRNRGQSGRINAFRQNKPAKNKQP